MQYFTVNEAVLLQRATTYEELAKIALAQLQRLNTNSLTRPGIVCGPISNGGLGSKKLNIAHFEKVVRHFTAHWHCDFFSQIPFEDALWKVQDLHAANEPGVVHPKGAGNPLLEEFYRPLFESGDLGSMYFIKGWESSDGARWEHDVGTELGLTIFHLDENLGVTVHQKGS